MKFLKVVNFHRPVSNFQGDIRPEVKISLSENLPGSKISRWRNFTDGNYLFIGYKTKIKFYRVENHTYFKGRGYAVKYFPKNRFAVETLEASIFDIF